MASNFPKLPGFVPTHDPTNVNHKKVSHVKLEQIRNAKNVPVPLHTLPRPLQKNFMNEKTVNDKSLSHTQFPCHIGEDPKELFEPTYVKLDKQVSLITLQSHLMASQMIWARFYAAPYLHVSAFKQPANFI